MSLLYRFGVPYFQRDNFTGTMVGMTEPTMPPYIRPAAVTAIASALFGLLIATIAAVVPWTIGRSGSLWTPLRGGAQGWLVSHGSGLRLDTVEVNLVPLGASLTLIALVAWVTIKTVIDSVGEIAMFVTVTALTYAVLVGAVSAVTQTDSATTSTFRAAAGGLFIAAVGGTIGLACQHGQFRELWEKQGNRVRAIGHGALAGLIALLVSAFALFAVMLALHVDRAGDLWSALEPGFFGGLALAILCLAMLPNLVLWTASALIGPGFSLGTDTSVDLTGSHLGAVPGLPLLAALPEPGQFPNWVFALTLVPLLAGCLAGWYFRKAYAGESGLLAVIIYGATSGASAGFVIGALIAISGGAIGPGRMAAAGPPPLTPLLAATLVLALGGAIGTLLGHYRLARAAATT